MREVYGTIRKLGATSKYKGYYFVAEAIRMTMEFQERPMKITKDIYPKLAKKFKSKPSNIEHDIRTIVNVCWENHRERLEVREPRHPPCALSYFPYHVHTIYYSAG